MMVPNELGGKVFAHIKDDEQLYEFERLLQDFTRKYENDPQFDYVKEL